MTPVAPAPINAPLPPVVQNTIQVNGQTRIEAGDLLYVCGNAEALKLLDRLS